MTKWLLLLGAIVSEVVGSLSLKGALDRPGLYVLVVVGYLAAFAFYAVVVVGYLAAFSLLALALDEGMGLGVAYGVWAAAGVALTAFASHFLFTEPLTPVMMGGIALIVAGVLLVEVGAAH